MVGGRSLVSQAKKAVSMIYKCEGAASFDSFDQGDIESAEVGLLRSSLSTLGEGMVGGMSLRSKRASVCGEPTASSCPSLSVSSMLSTSPSKPAATNASLVSMKPMGVTVPKKHGPYADKGHLITWIDAMRAPSPSRFWPYHGEIPDALDMEAAAYSAWLVSTYIGFLITWLCRRKTFIYWNLACFHIRKNVIRDFCLVIDIYLYRL